MFNCLNCVNELGTCPPFLSAATFQHWVNNSSLCSCVGDTIVPDGTPLVDYCQEAFSAGAPDCCPIMFVEREDGSICMNIGTCDEFWVCGSGTSLSSDSCVGTATGTNPANFITEAFSGICPTVCDVIHVIDGNGDVWVSSNPNNNCLTLNWGTVSGSGANCTEIVAAGTSEAAFLAAFSPRPTFGQCPILEVCYESTYTHLIHCWLLVNDGIADKWINISNGNSSAIELRNPATLNVVGGTGFAMVSFPTVAYDDLAAFNGTSFTVQDTGDYLMSCFASLCSPSPEAAERTLSVFINGLPVGGSSLTDTNDTDAVLFTYAFTQRLIAGSVVQLGFRSTGADSCVTEIRLGLQLVKKVTL